MSFNDGAFLMVEYTAWDLTDNNKVLYTNNADKAKELNIYDEKKRYQPDLMIVGSPLVLPGLNKALREASLNTTVKIELEPKDAFGERSEQLVFVMPLSEFKKQGMDPYVGMRIRLDNGVIAIVKSINSGRVVLDANPELAGHKLLYEIKVVKELTDLAEKIENIFKLFNLYPDSVQKDSNKIVVSFSKNQKKDHDYFDKKNAALSLVFNTIKDLKESIEIREEFDKQSFESSIKES
ncbi:MAG: putative FKBP-type peptidyl-prolyl cis-trans isomerase [Candidatus Micrarchaeota archaeon]|nr:MAG: putative FKBP-type peptidyl-prolyl cis-trans isomerase [Candidatus Micrarchaeota archaeon]